MLMPLSRTGSSATPKTTADATTSTAARIAVRARIGSRSTTVVSDGKVAASEYRPTRPEPAPSSPEPEPTSLRRLEARVLRAQRLQADGGESHDELGVVGERFDADRRCRRRTADGGPSCPSRSARPVD